MGEFKYLAFHDEDEIILPKKVHKAIPVKKKFRTSDDLCPGFKARVYSLTHLFRCLCITGRIQMGMLT